MSALGDAKYRESRGGPRVQDSTVTLKRASYRRAQERQRIAEAQREYADQDAERARAWARECLAAERRLAERCTYLYGLAARYGATDDELRGVLPEAQKETT